MARARFDRIADMAKALNAAIDQEERNGPFPQSDRPLLEIRALNRKWLI